MLLLHFPFGLCTIFFNSILNILKLNVGLLSRELSFTRHCVGTGELNSTVAAEVYVIYRLDQEEDVQKLNPSNLDVNTPEPPLAE